MLWLPACGPWLAPCFFKICKSALSYPETLLVLTRVCRHFYSITLNDVELSIFGDADLIETTHALLGQGEISDTTWTALQVEQHGEDWEDSGIRVREISAPLAAEGISILFQST
jgi:hypothetical protein